MGSYRDNDDIDKLKPSTRDSTFGIDDSDTETRDSDDHEGDSDDEFQCFGTVPVDDTVPFDDVETQAVTLCGETQPLNFAGETQPVDDVDCGVDICTQLFDDCNTEIVDDTDDEETERTQVLGGTKRFSDIDSVKGFGNLPAEHGDFLHTSLHNRVAGGSKASLGNKDCSIGYVCGGFTAFRVASLRASGLAARNMTSKGTKSSTKSIGQLLKQHDFEHEETSTNDDSYKSMEKINQENSLEECDDQIEGSDNENKCRVGKSAVRKVCSQDTMTENGLDNNTTNTNIKAEFPQFASEHELAGLGHVDSVDKSAVGKVSTEDTMAEKGLGNSKSNTDIEAELPQFASEYKLAGLSYVDSQEPGEASQANALDIVNKILKVHATEFDQEPEIQKFTVEKPYSVSGTIGTQSLAKSANRVSSVTAGGIFDWDDNQEDRGGGFFVKKRDEIFDKRRKSSIQSREPKFVNPKIRQAVIGNKAEEKQQNIHSDSKFLLHKSKVNDKSVKVTDRIFEKNLAKDLDKQFDIGSRDDLVEIGTNNNNLNMLSVGPDTQMAAEAMETLCFGVGVTDRDFNGSKQDAETCQNSYAKGKYITGSQRRPSHASNSRVVRRRSSQSKKAAPRLSKGFSVNVRNQCDAELIQAEPKKVMPVATEHFDVNDGGNMCKLLIENGNEEEALEKCDEDEIDKKQRMQEQLNSYTSVACCNRLMGVIQSQRDAKATLDLAKEINTLTELVAPKRKRSRIELNSSVKGKCAKFDLNQCGDFKNAKLTTEKRLDLKLSGSSTDKFDEVDHLGQGKTRRKSSSVHEEANIILNTSFKASQTDGVSICVDTGIKKKTRSLIVTTPGLPSVNRISGKRLLPPSPNVNTFVNSSPTKKSVVSASKDLVEAQAQATESCFGKSPANIEEVEANSGLEHSRRDVCTPSASACTPPANCTTPINEASPVCMGDEYYKQSCRKNLSRSLLTKETNGLFANEPGPLSTRKDCRKRRDKANIQVLFSQHLDGDIIKQQKKVLARLGASIASSVSDATHFVADKFVRTRNMLEAIAYGKPVVTHLWLESCGQASCLIDERNYILRDAKKEKEFGFSLPASLARASQNPLLQGQKVLITHNTKPGKEILSSLVKAVHAVAVDRIGRSASMDNTIPDNLLVLSCEEDYADCVPFLEIGLAVYSSELLLNGIITQKLEYERHRIFVDHAKRTRSTIALRNHGDCYPQATKCK